MNSQHNRRLVIAVGAVALIAACGSRESPHEHASEHPAGHDHHAPAHGHGDQPVLRATRWSENLELFSEQPAAVAGEEVALLAYLTRLEASGPLADATLRLELRGPTAIDVETRESIQPGIYRLAFLPPLAGVYRGRLVVSGSIDDVIDGITIEVFASDEAAQAAAPREEEEGRFIEFLKEQQWGVGFATEAAENGSLTTAIEVAGTVDAPPDGWAEVGAPIAGRVVPPPLGLPRPGETVRKGDLLATLAPAPSSPEEAARADLAVSEAQARLARAESNVARAERLLHDQAISQRELEDARREAQVAGEARRAAAAAQSIAAGGTSGASVSAGAWRLVAPIAGNLVDVRARPGASVAQGSLLFTILDARELWIRARVPEQDAARLRTDHAASFRIAGLDDFLPLGGAQDSDRSTGDGGASVGAGAGGGPDGGAGERAAGTGATVIVGRTIDPASRTVDVIYALRAPDPRLRVGGLVQVSIPAGPEFSGVVIPRAAIIDDDGRAVVYVQSDGEHFEERHVRTGARQGDRVAVVDGLAPGERIVTRGASMVRLAARAVSTEAHGHIH